MWFSIFYEINECPWPDSQDGFFDGELLDGRRGLVPSNYVEKLVGDDLLEFHQSVVVGLRESDESGSTTIPQDLEYINCGKWFELFKNFNLVFNVREFCGDVRYFKTCYCCQYFRNRVWTAQWLLQAKRTFFLWHYIV